MIVWASCDRYRVAVVRSGDSSRLSICGVLLAQKPFKEWPAIEYDDFPLPADWKQKAEWTRARLRYPDIYGYPDVPI